MLRSACLSVPLPIGGLRPPFLAWKNADAKPSRMREACPK
jgi:hypothetical protein